MDALKKLNLKFSFDEELREIPDDITDVALAIGLLRLQAKETQDLTQKTTILGQLGGWLRIMGELDEAEEILKEALTLIDGMTKVNPMRQLAARLRLAHVYQWKKDFKKSTPMFLSVLQDAQDKSMPEDLIAFIHQHLGKNFFDQSLYPEALSHFEKALEIRRQSGDQELIKSTSWAIEQTEQRLSKKH